MITLKNLIRIHFSEGWRAAKTLFLEANRVILNSSPLSFWCHFLNFPTLIPSSPSSFEPNSCSVGADFEISILSSFLDSLRWQTRLKIQNQGWKRKNRGERGGDLWGRARSGRWCFHFDPSILEKVSWLRDGRRESKWKSPRHSFVRSDSEGWHRRRDEFDPWGRQKCLNAANDKTHLYIRCSPIELFRGTTLNYRTHFIILGFRFAPPPPYCKSPSPLTDGIHFITYILYDI